MTHEPAVDKDEIVDEWKEGLHKIIERRSGPGEDVSWYNLDPRDHRLNTEQVEVEVVRNFYSPDGADRPSSERQSTMDKLRYAPHGLVRHG